MARVSMPPCGYVDGERKVDEPSHPGALSAIGTPSTLCAVIERQPGCNGSRATGVVESLLLSPHSCREEGIAGHAESLRVQIG